MNTQESLFHKALILCPKCGSEEPATIWDCVNARTDPDLKDRLLRKILQSHACANCGLEFAMAEPLVYHDPDRRLMIVVLPKVDPDQVEAPAAELAADSARLDRIAETVCGKTPAPQDGYRLRLVNEYNEMIEKIHIDDNDHNDRIMEVVKVAVRKNTETPAPPAGIAALFYLSEKDGEMTFLVRDGDGAWYGMNLPDSVYANTENLLGEALTDDGKWAVIDTAYAVEQINRFS